jgi:ParB-like chromosome segregation protein Spo0J
MSAQARRLDGEQAPAAGRVQVRSLLAGVSPRLNGENDEHIQLLAASEAPLPPILVHRETMQVIDGMHRLRAAQLRGQESIDVEFFDGSRTEAFIGAVKANIEHGLPLTLADRQAAAERIIDSHPHCSDRWIAATTGLGAATVAAIRRRNNPDGCKVAARVGRDGRVRPLSSEDGRRVARDVIARNPEASLREIARVAGISPATVRDVRQRMRRGDDPVSPKRVSSGRGRRVTTVRQPRPEHGQSRSRGSLRNPALLLQNLKRDPSLRFTDSGRALLRWLEARASGPAGWQDPIEAAPPHCAYLVAELARSCAEEWLRFARQLEQQLADRG